MVVFKGSKAFIVLAILFVSTFVLPSLCVHGFEEMRSKEANSIISIQVNDTSLTKKEVVVGAVGSSNEAKIGGRKMGIKKKLEDGEIMAAAASSSSRKDKNDSKKTPQDFFNSQGQENTLDQMTNNGENTIFSHGEQSDEWRKLLEDADKKVMQMMRRDYSGMKKPKRKPPINNNEPRN